MISYSSSRAVSLSLRLMTMTLLAGVLASCYWPRTPRSDFVPPPFDATRAEMREQAEQLRRDAQLHMREPREYYIGPGDVLGIALVGRPDVLGFEQVGGGGERRARSERMVVQVTESPVITLPLIGAVRVHGKTAQQLEDELRDAYSQFIANPIPVVTVDEFYYNQVNVLGSVRNPGRYDLEYGDTVLDAVFKAGGLTFGGRTGGLAPARFMMVYREKLDQRERADLSPAELLQRITRDDGVISPREEIVIPLEEFLLSGNLDYNIPLAPNDLVFIPPAGTVIVHGRAQNRGVVFMGPSVRTLTGVITEKGGLRYSAGSRAEVVRTYEDGSQETFFINMRRILRRDDVDFYMQDGDEVYIYVNPVRDVMEWFGNIFGAGIRTGASMTYAPAAGEVR